MKVFIAGVDGYLGWPLAQYLAARGHTIGGIDALLRRTWVTEAGGSTAIPIAGINDRLQAFDEHFGARLHFTDGNLLDYEHLKKALRDFQPDAVVHLAEMPSAAYSMIDAAHSAYTQQNNVIGSLNLLWAIKESCPEAHLVKLGTMGEYGTPDLDIPEGFFEVEFRGRTATLPFPRQPGSIYHLSKVHDSHNTLFACRIWGLRSTDIMQGVVFGSHTQPDMRLNTRLDFDQCFGTVINRFCCQAVINHPLTIYGAGNQKRGFLPLNDSLQCITIAIENPPEAGEYRVFNQFEACYSIEELAHIVQQVAGEYGLNIPVQNFDNPRKEAENHYYNPDRQKLIELGYRPTHDIEPEIRVMLAALIPQSRHIRVYQHLLIPDIRWDGTRQRSRSLERTISE